MATGQALCSVGHDVQKAKKDLREMERRLEVADTVNDFVHNICDILLRELEDDGLITEYSSWDDVNAILLRRNDPAAPQAKREKGQRLQQEIYRVVEEKWGLNQSVWDFILEMKM